MPIFSLKLPFADFRGRVSTDDRRRGLITTSAPTQGHTARAHNPHKPPATPAQLAIRAHIANSAKAWTALPAATAADWRSLAQQITRNNSLGYTYRLTGIGLWNQVQHYRQLDGQAIDPALPLLTDIPPPPSALYWCYPDGGSINARLWSPAAPPASRALIRLTNSSPNQARLRQQHELRICTTDPADSFAQTYSNVYDWFFKWDTGIFLADEWCGLSFVCMSQAYLPRAPWYISLHQLTIEH